MRKGYILFFVGMFFLFSCKKENQPTSSSGSVIIIDEGGFGHDNADLSLYNPQAKTVSNNVFSSENGFALGDVAQSLCMINDTAYIVMNNSQRIVIANAGNNFKYIDTIYIPGSSPRFFMPVSGSKAYVTELYADKIWVINYRTRTVLKTIPVNGWTEQMVSWGGRIYVCQNTAPGGPPSHNILMIDTALDQVVNSISLTSDPSGSMALTAQNKLFVLAQQQTSPALNASLYEIDMPSFTIQRQINFSPTRTPDHIRYSSFSNVLLFSDGGGIYSMSPSDTVIPPSAFIASNGWNVYGLNADPSNGDIYISDAVDYQQASHIKRFSRSAASVDAFTAGLIANGFVFR